MSYCLIPGKSLRCTHSSREYFTSTFFKKMSGLSVAFERFVLVYEIWKFYPWQADLSSLGYLTTADDL